MNEYARQACIALEVYLERGLEIYDNALRAELDGLDDLLRKRDAAFYNFKALDFLSLKHGTDLALDKKVIHLWDSIKAINKNLEITLKDVLNNSARDIKQLQVSRGYLKKYRSGYQTRSGFEQAI